MLVKKFNEEKKYKEEGFKFIRFIVDYNKSKTKKAQELAFNYNYTWSNGYKGLLYLDESYELDFNTKNKRITYCPEYEPLESREFSDDYIVVDTFADLEIYLNTDGKGDQFQFFYNKKGSNIYENKKSVDLLVFEAKTDDDVVKAQEYAFKNGYTWYGGGTRIGYNKLSNCKYFFYETEDKKLTISTDLEDKTYEDFIKEYYDTDNFIIINDINGLEYNLKTDGRTFYNYYNNQKLVYENVQDEEFDYILFKPKTEKECNEIQTYAFEHGWVWGNGKAIIMNSDAKMLYFEINEKEITYSPSDDSIEDVTEFYKEEYDEIIKGTDDILVIKYFIRTGKFSDLSFNDIYNKNRKIYESIEDGINYIDVLLPDRLSDKEAYIRTIEDNGWVSKSVLGQNPIIINNLEEANILHIFCGHFPKEFLLIKHSGGMEGFVTEHLAHIINEVKVINDLDEFLDTFDLKYLSSPNSFINRYIDRRKNIYE